MFLYHRSFPHPSGDPSVAFLHLDAFHIEPKPGVAPQDAMTAVVEEVQDPTDAAPAAAQPEAPAGPAGAVAVSRGDAMWTFQYRPAVNAGARLARWEQGANAHAALALPQNRLTRKHTAHGTGSLASPPCVVPLPQAAPTWSSCWRRSTPSARR